jgi:hypothetical protein
MKPSQTMVLLVVAVALVFGVTFASMYVSQSRQADKTRTKKKQTVPSLQLTFASVRYPEGESFNDVRKRVVTEYEKWGQHDFWFENNNDEEVLVGVAGTCTCSEVRLLIAPDSWRKTYKEAPAARPELSAKAEGLIEVSRAGVMVPAKSFGFLRLGWTAKRDLRLDPHRKLEKKLYAVDLWFQDPRWSNVRLEVGAVLADGVEINVTDLDAGTLKSRDVASREVVCLSRTRPNFEVEVDSPVKPFIRCVSKVPLTEPELKRLASVGPVASGYKLKIEVREEVDRAHFDEGLFTHTLHVRPPADVILPKPLEIAVRGRVRGDVTVIGADNGIELQPFNFRESTTHQVTLQTGQRDIQLKVDHKPSFMTVTLGEPRMVDGSKTWLLSLKTEPNKVIGAFPRADSEELRDCAIYLKVEGATNRRLRIPVSGIATQ